MKELRVIIAGSRDFNNYELLKKSVIEIIEKKTMFPDLTRIVSGGARGADILGERFANEMELKTTRFIPDWDGLGKRAGYVRNAEMAKYAKADGNYGVLIAFWDGKSKGTKHMIDLAEYGYADNKENLIPESTIESVINNIEYDVNEIRDMLDNIKGLSEIEEVKEKLSSLSHKLY